MNFCLRDRLFEVFDSLGSTLACRRGDANFFCFEPLMVGAALISFLLFPEPPPASERWSWLKVAGLSCISGSP